MRMRTEGQMKQDTLYKNHLIQGEAFQREKNGAWVPQYTVTRQDAATEKRDYPSHQYQFNHTYRTEGEADEFAVQKAREWIDKN
jgi:hypothetical protein